MAGLVLPPPLWKPRGLVEGVDWRCTIALISAYDRSPRAIHRAYATIAYALPGGGVSQICRLDDSGNAGTGFAGVGGAASNQVILFIPGSLSRGWDDRPDALVEVFVEPADGGDPYCLIPGTRFPIQGDAAEWTS